MVAYIRAGERPAIKRPPRTWRAGGRAGRLNCARRLGRAYAEVVWQMLADAVRLGVIRRGRPEAWAAGAVAAGARGNGPSASSSRAVITRPKRGYAVRSIEVIAARPNGARPPTNRRSARPVVPIASMEEDAPPSGAQALTSFLLQIFGVRWPYPLSAIPGRLRPLPSRTGQRGMPRRSRGHVRRGDGSKEPRRLARRSRPPRDP